MRASLYLSVLGFFCVQVLSCRSDTQDSPERASLIDGDWHRPCLYMPELQLSQTVELSFRFGRQFARLESYFADDDCQNAAFEIRYQGRYELTVTWEQHQYILDFWVGKALMKGISAAWLQEANQNSYCGKNDWEKPLDSQELSGLHSNCPLLFVEDNYHKNLIEVHAGHMAFAGAFRPGLLSNPKIDEGQKALQFVRTGVSS